MARKPWAGLSIVWATLVCLFVLFSFTSICAAYPAPVIESASIRSEKASDGSYATVMVARLTGPSPYDVAHFSVSGPGGTFALDPSTPSKRGLYYVYSHPDILPDGYYVFEAQDNMGRRVAVPRAFNFADTIGRIDASTMTPLDGAYTGTVTPTLSFTPLPDSEVYYQVELWDYSGHALWFLSPIAKDTSITVPEGLLQPDTPYSWVVRTWDDQILRGNLNKSERRRFYTGVMQLPDVTNRFSASLTDGAEYGHVFVVSETGLAPWDVNRLQVTGPEASPVVDVALDRLDCRFATPALYYQYLGLASPIPDGTYTFELEDVGQNIGTGSVDFAAASIPTVSDPSRYPENNHYFDTRTPTFSWNPVSGTGPYYYKVEIIGYSGEPEWFISPWSPDTSVTIPAGALVRGNSYTWEVWVSDGNGTTTPIKNMNVSSEWTFTINALEPLLISTPNLKGVDFFVAHKAIDIDGDYNDWDVTDRIYLDTGGADCGDVAGRDIREVYLAQDNSNLYLRYVLNGTLDDTFGYKFGERFHVVIDLDNGAPRMFYSVPDHGGMEVMGGAVHIDGNQFECMLPKNAIRAWQGQELSAWCDQGADTVCRDHIDLPGMNLDMPGRHVDLSLAEGQTKTVYVSGGTGEYNIGSSNTQIASATLTGGAIRVLGVSEGTATITVADGETTVDIDVTVVRAGRIAGTVTDGQGVPLAGQWISVSGYAHDEIYERGMTQPDGSYIVYGLPAGDYRVAVPVPGASYVPEYFNGSYDFNGALPVTVAEDETTTGIDFSLDTHATISGDVASTGGTPLPGVQVVAFTAPCWDNCLNSADRNLLDESTTDENGHYTLSVPAVGAYVLACANCAGQNYVNRWWNGGEGAGNCQEAAIVENVPGGVTSDIDFSLEPGRIVSGTVTTALGDPLEEVEVMISAAPCFESFLGQQEADANGNYTVLGIPPGEIYVFADAASEDLNYVNEWWNGAQGAVDCNLAAPATVPFDQDLTDMDFALDEGISISGRVTAGNGHPLEGVGVGSFLGECQEGNPCRRNFLSGSETDGNGDYLIEGLPADYVYVGAVPYKEDLHYVGRWWDGGNGTVDCSGSLPIDLSQGHVSGADFSLDEEGFVFGRVTDSLGTPLPGIPVQAYLQPCGEDYFSQGHTNQDGYYVIPGLPPGDVYVTACAFCDGFDYITQWWDGAQGTPMCNGALAVTVQPGIITKGIHFSLEGAGSVSGRVTGSGGEPIVGAEVTAFSEPCHRGESQYTGITDENGSYTVFGLTGGSFYVQAVSPVSGASYVSEWWDSGPGTTNCNEAAGVSVIAGEETSAIDFVLEEGGCIAGQVSGNNGLPVENVPVRVFSDLCGENRVGEGISGVNGDFTICGLAAGDIFAWACPECSDVDYVGEWWNDLDGTSDCAGAFPVSITQGETAAGIDFSLVQKGAIILTPGVPYEGTIDPQDTEYFAFVPEAGRSVLVEVAPQSGIDTIILDGELGDLPAYPDTGTYSTRNTTPRGNYEILISPADLGTYYFSLFGYRVAPLGGAYSITARYLDEQYLSNISTSSGSNSGAVTFALEGVGFSEETLVTLAGTGLPSLTPSQVVVVSPTKIYVTFDLTAAPVGTYDVQIEKTDETPSVLTGAFQVVSGVSGHLQVHAIAPELVRPNRTYTFWLEYENDGGADMPAPLFVVSNNVNAKMSLYKNGFFKEGPIQVLGVSPENISGSLLIGSRNRVPIYYKVPDGLAGHSFVKFQVHKVAADKVDVDWNSLELQVKPTEIDDDAWDIIWSNFRSRVGSTWNEYLRQLQENSSYISLYRMFMKSRLEENGIKVNSQRDVAVYDVNTLLQYELAKASARLSPIATLGDEQDLFIPSPGLDLRFRRFLPTSIQARFRAGALGRGWTHIYEIKASLETNGDIVLTLPGGGKRMFVSLGNGTYKGTPGETGSVELSGDDIILREKSGLVYRFNSLQNLIAMEDPNGNTLTFKYQNEGLSLIEHSCGESMAFTYNSSGRLDQLTGSNGMVVMYRYDVTGEHLTEVEKTGGVITGYDYHPADGSTSAHTLTSVTFPDGLKQYYNYDNAGRLAEFWKENNFQRKTFVYDDQGTVTTTDAVGNIQFQRFGPHGEILETSNGLGERNKTVFDQDLHVVKTIRPSGHTDSYVYNLLGDYRAVGNDLFGALKMNYSKWPSRLLGFIDTKKNETLFDYDTAGNMQRITYPNYDGVVKSPISALRCIPRHCDVR